MNTKSPIRAKAKLKVAVLLAAYNGSSFIEEQIASIVAQKSVEVDLFVSVDVSSDGTESLVNLLADSHRNIHVLPHGQKFGAAGPNFYRLLSDVDLSNFDYIAFSDQDDIWLPDKLRHAIEISLDAHAEAYSSNVTAFWPDGREQMMIKSQPQTSFDYLFEAAGPGCTYVFSKDLATHMKSVLISNHEIKAIELHDWLIYAFARTNGYRWIIDDYSGVMYRQHELNQVGANSGIKAFMTRAKKVLAGWGFSQSYLIAKAIGMEDHPFVKVWSRSTRFGYLRLALFAWSCRRRLRDKFFFMFACLLLSIVRPSVKSD